jgi:hypothetical protein
MPVQAAQINLSFESKITYNFIKAGLESNRVVALYKAVGVIATSSILIVTHTTTGLLKSVVFLSQGDLENATSEMTKGLSKSTHSIVTIFQVTVVALYGLAVGAKAYEGINLPTDNKTASPEDLKPKEPLQEFSEIQHPLAPIIQKLQAMITAMQQELETQKTAYAQLKKTYESNSDQLKKDCLACLEELDKEIALKNQQIEHFTEVFQQHLHLLINRASQSRLEGNEQPPAHDPNFAENSDLYSDLEALQKMMETSEKKKEEPFIPVEISIMRTPTKGSLSPQHKSEKQAQKKTTAGVPFNLTDKENIYNNFSGVNYVPLTN